MNQIFEYFIQIFASKKEIEKAPKYVISEVPKANNKLSLEKNSENNIKYFIFIQSEIINY